MASCESTLLRVRYGQTWQEERKTLAGLVQPGHVHMLISVPPEYAMFHMAGYRESDCGHALAVNSFTDRVLEPKFSFRMETKLYLF